MEEKGIVYILTNPLYKENIIKIGSTTDIKSRLKNLSRGTGVPGAFECYVAYEVKNYKKVEDLMQKIYKGVESNTDKTHKKKEFFNIAPDLADEVLSTIVELMKGKKVPVNNAGVYTKEQQKQLDSKEKRQIAKKFKFSNYEIPVGSELVFTKNHKIKCEVGENNKVIYKKQEYSLSGLTIKLMQELQYSGTHYNGYAYWTYKDILLTELSKNIGNLK